MDVLHGSALASALALLCAVLIDAIWGEPPARWHPVVAMGHVLDGLGRHIAPLAGQAQSPRRVFVRGALAWCLGALAVLLVALGLDRAAAQLPWFWQGLVLGGLLKPLLAWRMLREEVLAVEAALACSLEAGRARVARLVSRDVAQLDAVQVREAAIATLAENFNDSVVAPLFWFVLAGLPGAALYRYANTADAMWGYRGLRGGRDWTWAGCWAARVDDVLSWWPARCSAVLLALPRFNGLRLCQEAARTPSPNGGWPMGAMALALDIRLGKPGVYQLHAAGRPPQAADVQAACRRGDLRLLCGVSVLLVLEVLAWAWTQR